MGLLHELSTISYNQTKSQQIKAERDKLKQEEERLKKDVKRYLKFYLEMSYTSSYDFVKLYQEKNTIATNVFNEVYNNYNVDSYDLVDYIEEQFEKEFDKYKREKEKVKRLKQEQARESERQNRKNAKGLSLKDIPLAYKSLAFSIILDKATKNWNKPRKY